jgi:hypothetical protein
MAKWKQGDILVFPDNDLAKGIKVLGVGQDQYMISTLYVLIRKIISITEIDSLPYHLYKGEEHGSQKNTSPNNGEGTTQTRRVKTDRSVPKDNAPQLNRRTVSNPKADGGRPSLHRKSRTSRRWKNKKKSSRNRRKHAPNQDLRRSGVETKTLVPSGFFPL